MVSGGGALDQTRLTDTPHGPILYTLRRKAVKNLNLRLGRDGAVTVSVPVRCPADRADRFVAEHSGWILRTRARQREEGVQLPPRPDRTECARLLEEALARVYPLVAPLGVAFPQLRLRALKSQWGNCHWSQGYITLNTALARCPEGLRDYVALHELVHFLHHDHGPGFYARMDALMPDWRQRRGELKRWGGALEGETEGGKAT